MSLLGSLLARTFASPCLGRKHKARVATLFVVIDNLIVNDRKLQLLVIEKKFNYKLLE
jgi:hypothetical protein